MKTSESVKELATALVQVQKNVPAFPKTASGYGYKYTPIDDIINGLRPLLTANNLLLTQTVGDGGDEAITLTTTVIHAPSGEWLTETATIPAPAVGKANAAQQAGAAITYLRRYSLSALFFLASEGDSDAATETNAPQPERRPAPPPQPNGNGKADPTKQVTIAMLKDLHVKGKTVHGEKWEGICADVNASLGVDSSKLWPWGTYWEVMNGLNAATGQPAQQDDLFG